MGFVTSSNRCYVEYYVAQPVKNYPTVFLRFISAIQFSPKGFKCTAVFLPRETFASVRVPLIISDQLSPHIQEYSVLESDDGESDIFPRIVSIFLVNKKNTG